MPPTPSPTLPRASRHILEGKETDSNSWSSYQSVSRRSYFWLSDIPGGAVALVAFTTIQEEAGRYLATLTDPKARWFGGENGPTETNPGNSLVAAAKRVSGPGNLLIHAHKLAEVGHFVGQAVWWRLRREARGGPDRTRTNHQTAILSPRNVEGIPPQFQLFPSQRLAPSLRNLPPNYPLTHSESSSKADVLRTVSFRLLMTPFRHIANETAGLIVSR